MTTLDEAIREIQMGVIACAKAGSSKLGAFRMAAGALQREEDRRPPDFDFEDVKLPGETQ